MRKNYSTNQRPGNKQEFSGAWPKVNKAAAQVHDNELAYPFRAESYQEFVCKCTETAQPIRGQETAEIQWSTIKS